MNETAVKVKGKWQFKTKFRAKALAWRAWPSAALRWRRSTRPSNISAAARQIGAVGWAHQNLGKLVAYPCTPGREDIPANREGRIVAIRSRDGLSLAAILTK
jgi:hypothetical protein